MERMFLHPRCFVVVSAARHSAGMASKRATCVRALTDEEIQELLMNSDSDESENDDAAQLSDLSSDDSEEEPVPLKKNTRQGVRSSRKKTRQ